VDETIEVPLPEACPDCGGTVESHGVADQYQTDVPPVRPHVTHFRIHLGTCAGCGKAVRGRHSKQTSKALGAAASQLGPQAVAIAAHLNKGLGLSFDKCRVLFKTAFGIGISRSGLSQALDRLADAAEPTYQGLLDALRQAPVVSPDETGWKVGGELQWLWAFATPELTVYAIQDGRGFKQAAGVLGAEYDGVLIRDGWAPYRRFEEATHQSCLAHLLRRSSQLRDTAVGDAACFPQAVHDVLRKGLDLRDRYLQEEISRHGLAVATGRLEAEMRRLLEWELNDPANLRFLKHLKREQPHLFTFLHDFDVEATNWWSEQAIRPAVVTRKVWGGNRTWAGALTQEVLASILATSRKQGQHPYAVLSEIYRSPQPMVIRFDPASPTLLQPP
jgi:transposase